MSTDKLSNRLTADSEWSPATLVVETPATQAEASMLSWRDRIPKTMSWVLVGRTLSIGLNFLAGVLVARNLTQADYGRFELFVCFITIGGALTTLGTSDAIVRIVVESLAVHNVHRAIGAFKNTACIALVGSILTLLLVPCILYLFATIFSPTLGLVLLLGLGAIFLGWLRFLAMSLQALDNQKWAHLLGSGHQGGGLFVLCFALGIVGLLATNELSLNNLLSVYVSMLAATTLLAIYLTWSTIHQKLILATPDNSTRQNTLHSLKNTLTLTLSFFVIQLLMIAGSQADTWLAAAYVTPDNLALYAASRRVMLIVAMPLQFAVLSLRHVIPKMFILQEIKPLQRVLQVAATWASLPSIVAIALLAILGDRVMASIFGAAYADAYWPLLIMAIGQLVFVLTGLCSQLLMLTGYHNAVLLIEGIGLALFLVLTPFFAGKYDIYGVAVAASLCMASKNLAFWALARRLDGIWTHPLILLRG